MRLHEKKDYFNSDERTVVKYRKTSKAIKLHGHDYSEIMYVVKGSGIHTIGDREYPFIDGSLFFVPGGLGHMISFDKETEYYDILISDDVIEEMSDIRARMDMEEEMLPEIASNCTAGAYSKMCEICAMAYNEYEGGFPGTTDILLAQIRIIYVFLLRYRGTVDIDTTPAKRRTAMPEILDYINIHYKEPIKMYEIAQMYHYSPNYFSKLFKKNFGMGFYEYIHKKRIASAKEYLKICDNSVEEICRAVGYSNNNEFYKMFKEYTDMTPSEYRNARKQNRNRFDLTFPNDKTGKRGEK
ncbi:MAG: AraC family transcriptional regulator [Clostridia bacterium]|nr:AraC family transcriptional regulator [Clostridia bacterium]